MLWNSGLADIYAENSALHECVVRKGEEYFNALSDNSVCSSLILYQNSASGSFLKITRNVEFETISENFS